MEAISRLPFAELERAIRLQIMNFVNFTGEIDVRELESRSWASVTFSGARHRLKLTLSGPEAPVVADSFLSNLSEAEFALRGHVLADIALVSDRRPEGRDTVVLEIEALTVEDC